MVNEIELFIKVDFEFFKNQKTLLIDNFKINLLLREVTEVYKTLTNLV